MPLVLYVSEFHRVPKTVVFVKPCYKHERIQGCANKKSLRKCLWVHSIRAVSGALAVQRRTEKIPDTIDPAGWVLFGFSWGRQSHPINVTPREPFSGGYHMVRRASSASRKPRGTGLLEVNVTRNMDFRHLPRVFCHCRCHSRCVGGITNSERDRECQ